MISLNLDIKGLYLKKTIKDLFNESDKRTIIEIARHEEDKEFAKFLEDLYKDDESSNKKHYDDNDIEKQYRKIKRAYRNRKPSNLKVLGKFYKNNRGEYIIDIYYRNFKRIKDINDPKELNELTTNIKATFIHELFHFIHCLCLEDEGYSWNNSISDDINGENKRYVSDIIIEGFAEKFKLDYLKTIDSSLYEEQYKNLYSYSIFSYPYSASIMLDKLDTSSLTNHYIKDIFSNSISSFIYSSYILFASYFKEFYVDRKDEFVVDFFNIK